MKFVLFLLLSLLSAGTFAQSIITFTDKVVALKNIKADDSPTQVTFTFKNTGNQPLIITRVNPMSNQLKADWDRAPVIPGASGTIKISFLSSEMPENFDYPVTIFCNAQNNREQLRVMGNVVDNPAKEELLYKFNMSDVKFKSNVVQFDKIYTWQILSDTLYFFNTRKDTLTVGTNYLPAHVTADIQPKKVAPGKKGMIIITFDAPKKNDYGYVYESIILSFNNEKSYTNRLSLTANVVEDFTQLNKKQLADAPVASFDKKEIAFPDLKPGEKANCDFILTNSGKSNLIVRKTRASCGCTAVALGENTIAPGKSTTIRATFDSTGKTGRQYKSITIITNDPKTPEINLTITGNILNK